MADEAQYSSGPDTWSNKRKYEEQPAPTTRRVTGFSAPIIASSSPDSVPTSYSSVPPPVEDIQLAKQRAQEIAAQLFNNASSGAAAAAGLDTKRPRVENGGGFDSSDKGFSSIPTVSYGFQGGSKKIDVPNGRVGVIIGKQGETIKYLQAQSGGAKIQVTGDADADPNCPTSEVEIMGTPDQIAKAEHLINEVLAEAESGGPAIVSRRSTGQAGSEQFVMKIPNNKILIDKMGKKSKSKNPREVEENTVGEKSAVEEGKPSSCANKPVASVIDEIFAGKKRKKTEAEKAKKQNEEPNRPKRKKKKKDLGFEDGAFVDQTSRSKKRTSDGLAIYTEEELGINKADAGSTPLCPFDCSCCF